MHIPNAAEIRGTAIFTEAVLIHQGDPKGEDKPDAKRCKHIFFVKTHDVWWYIIAGKSYLDT